MNTEHLKKIFIPTVIILLLIGLSIGILTPVFNMIILGAIFAYGLKPISERIESKIKFKSISVIIAIIIILVPLILILAYLTLQTADLTFNIINNHVNNLNSTQITSFLNQSLPEQYHSYLNTINTELSSTIYSALHSIFDYIMKLLKSIPYISLELFVLFFSTYYFTKDGDRLWDYVKTFTPENEKDFFNELYFQIDNVLKSIFFGHFLTSVILGIIGGVGYYILGYPFALFLGILTGIMQLIPIFGPWVVYSVLVAMDIFSGNYIRAVITLFFGFFLSVSDMYIRPALSSKYADIHPLILFLGFVSGPLVFGIVGFITGPLILGITYAVIKTYKIKLDEKKKKKIEE